MCNTTVLSVYVNLQNFLASKIFNENWLLLSLTSAKVIVTKVCSTCSTGNLNGMIFSDFSRLETTVFLHPAFAAILF